MGGERPEPPLTPRNGGGGLFPPASAAGRRLEESRDGYLMLVVLADGCSQRLRFLQRLIDCLAFRDHLGELLGDLVAKLLELVDVDVLDANVWNRVHSRMSDVRVRDRLEGDVRESACSRFVLRNRVGRGARSWRHTGPAQLGPNQLGVVLVGGPV